MHSQAASIGGCLGRAYRVEPVLKLRLGEGMWFGFH